MNGGARVCCELDFAVEHSKGGVHSSDALAVAAALAAQKAPPGRRLSGDPPLLAGEGEECNGDRIRKVGVGGASESLSVGEGRSRVSLLLLL